MCSSVRIGSRKSKTSSGDMGDADMIAGDQTRLDESVFSRSLRWTIMTSAPRVGPIGPIVRRQKTRTSPFPEENVIAVHGLRLPESKTCEQHSFLEKLGEFGCYKSPMKIMLSTVSHFALVAMFAALAAPLSRAQTDASCPKCAEGNAPQEPSPSSATRTTSALTGSRASCSRLLEVTC